MDIRRVANNNQIFSIVEDIEVWVKTLNAGYALSNIDAEQFLVYTQKIKDIITKP